MYSGRAEDQGGEIQQCVFRWCHGCLGF